MRRQLRTAAVVGVVAGGLALVAVAFVVTPGRRTAPDFVVAFGYQVFSIIGGYLMIRRPDHPIGPLFVVTGLGSVGQGFGEAVTEHAQAVGNIHGSFVHVAVWVQAWLWVPTLAVPLVFVPLLFPDGRPLSPRWRWVIRLGGVGLGLAILPLAGVGLTLSTRQLLQDSPHLEGWQALVFPVAAVGVITCLVCAVLGVVSLVVRFRRGDAVTRQQIKLVLFAAGLAIVLVMSGSVFSDYQNFLEPGGTALIAIAVGTAVLRYRLFDIDRVVSRTLAYAIVTALLVATYIGAVAVTTRLLPVSSGVGVAASTLAVAAAFNPLRRRVQAVVDRRFNRERYDATRTVETFSVRLRDEVDPEAVRHDLLGVAARVVEPASVSIWVAD